jgi:hypothetical protein
MPDNVPKPSGGETWFRGESTNAPPAKAGGHLHDFGDGVYFTSSKAVAEQYANTRVHYSGGTISVYEVTIQRTDLGRVLDLTSDPRWRSFMTTPIIPGQMERTPEKLIQLANENYNGFFREFLKRNNIDIRQYDAVIGPEFVRGGNQLAILHKNGQPSPTAVRIRGAMVPIGSQAKLKSPTVDLSNYPSDSDRPVTRLFKDRPVLKKAGLIGGSVVASLVAGKALDLVQKHFEDVLGDARKEFQSKFPDPAGLARNARIDQHRKAYEAALAKLRAPSAAKAVGALMIAVASDKDRDAVVRHVQTQLSKIKLAGGGVGGFDDAASAYIDAMADLSTQLFNYRTAGLDGIAENVKQRAEVLQRTGDNLTKTFWSGVKVAMLSPLTYYPWLDVYNVAQVFLDLGGQVGGFATEISGRARAYEQLAASLDKELLKVSEQLGKFAP